jgi:hypothetical protein
MPVGDLLVLIYIVAAFVVFAAVLAWVSRTPSTRPGRSGRLSRKRGPAVEHR